MIDTAAWLSIWDEPDLEAIRELSADDLEVTAVTAAIEPRHYSGRDAAVRWLTDLRERLRADWSVTKLTVLGTKGVVVEGVLHFVEAPATTGTDDQRFAVLMRLRDGKVHWIGTFMTPEAAREAWERGAGA